MLRPTNKLRFVNRSVLVKSGYEQHPPKYEEVRVLQQFWEETINVGWAELSVNDKTGVWRDVELVDDAE
jgi:hypothetical protein